MKPMHWRRSIVGGVAMACLAVWLVKRTPPAPPEAADEAPTESDPARAVAAPTVAPAAHVPELLAAPVAPVPPAADAPFKLDPQVIEGLPERARERALLNKRWEGQPVDGAWRDQSVQRVQSLLAQANLDTSALRNVDCRQTICRFELASKTDREAEVLNLINTTRTLDDETWLQPEANADGTWRMEVYFPKPGYRLSGDGGRIGDPVRAVDAPELAVATPPNQ